MGKPGRENPKRKGGNQNQDNRQQQQPAILPSQKHQQQQSKSSSSKSSVQIDSLKNFKTSDWKLKAVVQVDIRKECRLLAEKALKKKKLIASDSGRVDKPKESSDKKKSTSCSRAPHKDSQTRKEVLRGSPKKITRKVEISVSRESRTPPRRASPSPKTKTSPKTSGSPSNRSRRKALVRAITRLRKQSKSKPKRRRSHKQRQQLLSPSRRSTRNSPAKRELRERKQKKPDSDSDLSPRRTSHKRSRVLSISTTTSASTSPSSSPRKLTKMDINPREEMAKDVAEPKSDSSNDAPEEEIDNNANASNSNPNNESDSDDDDDVEMQVLEKQVHSDEDEEPTETDEPPLAMQDDDESVLLSPSALPASSLFRSPSRRKKRESGSSSGIIKVEQNLVYPSQSQPLSQYASSPSGSPYRPSYSSPYQQHQSSLSLSYPKTVPASFRSFPSQSSSGYSTSTSRPYGSGLLSYPSLASSPPEKRARGRPRKALEDVKSVSGKLYRKKLAEKGFGRGRPIYAPSPPEFILPSTSTFQHESSPYDENFDDGPSPLDMVSTAPTTTTTSSPPDDDQDLGKRMERWQNRSTFIYAKHKFRQAPSENGKTKDKFMCKVCRVGFTALSSLKRHYGTIYHKQQEQADRNSGEFEFSSPSSTANSSQRNSFQFQQGRGDHPGMYDFPSGSASSSSSPTMRGRGGPGRSGDQPRTSSFVRKRTVGNIKKYYAAADAARRRKGVDGSGSGSWLQKQHRRRKPLLHSDYIYQSSLSQSYRMDDDDDDEVDGDYDDFPSEDEMGLVRDEDAENNWPLEEDERRLEREREREPKEQPWLSNAWKGHGVPHFTCEVCGESHSNKREFTRHLYQHRQEEEREQTAKVLTCPDCQLCYPNESVLENHFRLFGHGSAGGGGGLNLKRFTCNLCHSAFSRLEYYKKHLEFHKRPPIQCPHCPKKFSYKFYLQDHIKIMHEWTHHNGNGTEGLEGEGENAMALACIVNPPPMNSAIAPKPKIELFCQESSTATSTAVAVAAPISTRKNSSAGALSQILPTSEPIPTPGKRRGGKPGSASALKSISKMDPYSYEEDEGGMGALNVKEEMLSPRPKECVNLFKKFFDGDRSEEEDNISISATTVVKMVPGNMLPDVEQSTTEDGNLVWQFKPFESSGLGGGGEENVNDNASVPSLTIEIPRDKFDFGGEEKEEGKPEEEVAQQQQQSQKKEEASKKEDEEKAAIAAGCSPSLMNLPLIGCGSKSTTTAKPLKSPLVCQDCGKSYEQRKSLVKHVQYYQAENFSCTICGKMLRLKHHVTRHMKTAHNIDSSSTSGAENQMDFLSSPSGSSSGGLLTPTEKDASCSGVSFEGKFTSTFGTSRPASSSVSFKQSLNPNPASKPVPKKIRRRLESSPAAPSGSTGSVPIPTASAFKKKASSVTSEPGRTSATEELLTATTIVASEGFSAFKCLLCKKLYPSKHQLNSHMWYHKKRSSTLPHKCSECPAEFKFKQELNTHQYQVHGRSASNDKPTQPKHVCAKCPGKPSFGNRKELQKHLKDKHQNQNQEEEEELESTDKIQVSRCPFCPLAFPRESDLNDHMNKEHMQCISCDECGLVLGDKKQLREHIEKEHSQNQEDSDSNDEDEEDEDEGEEEEEDDDDDDNSPPTPSPHTSPLHIPSFARAEEEEDVEEEEEEEPQEDPESEFELLELN